MTKRVLDAGVNPRSSAWSGHATAKLPTATKATSAPHASGHANARGQRINNGFSEHSSSDASNASHTTNTVAVAKPRHCIRASGASASITTTSSATTTSVKTDATLQKSGSTAASGLRGLVVSAMRGV